jgi:hypothetical protein
MDAEGVRAWVDNYCLGNPLEPVAKAGWAFIRAHPR